MDTGNNGVLDYEPIPSPVWQNGAAASTNGHSHSSPPRGSTRDMEFLRSCAWEIGERRPVDHFTPTANHVGLGMVTPTQGFAHWRILPTWVDQAARQKGNAWHNCRLIVRLYDVSYITFNGLNAHRIQDQTLPSLCGQLFFKLPRAGTWQLAEVGFLLRNGEFLPAARSHSVSFPLESGSPRGSQAALLVNEQGRIERIGNVWDQQRILHERRQPKLRQPLRIGTFAFASLATGHDGTLARFVSELASGQCARGHEVHVVVPASAQFNTSRQVDGVHYHPLEVRQEGTPLEVAEAFGQAAESLLQDLPSFDLLHLHEWMTGLVPWCEDRPTVLSLSSIEATRRNGTPPSEVSLAIEKAEREAAQAAACVLTPPWLRDRAVTELGLGDARVRAFPMEGRLPNQWEAPLDVGQVKMEIGFGPLDRLLVFVGPLEHAAGVDVLLEAMPTVLHRAGNLRLAFVGAGNMYGHLQHRANQLGVAWAVRLLGHMEGDQLTRLLRSAEALVLPSRFRVPFDDAVVDLARRAARPVVTTHSGPAHLVRHEENGILTYDNPGSMVWAVDRILGDPTHAERMGRNGARPTDTTVVWSEVANHYLEFCGAYFPELSERHM